MQIVFVLMECKFEGEQRDTEGLRAKDGTEADCSYFVLNVMCYWQPVQSLRSLKNVVALAEREKSELG